MLNANFQIPIAKCQMKNAKCQMKNAKWKMQNSKCKMKNAMSPHQMRDISQAVGMLADLPIAPGPNVIKLFTVVIYKYSW